MTTESTNLLLSWENVERLPELQRLKLVLDTLPSEKVIAALKARRGHGRNDFPVETMFNALIAGIVCFSTTHRVPCCASCIGVKTGSIP